MWIDNVIISNLSENDFHTKISFCENIFLELKFLYQGSSYIFLKMISILKFHFARTHFFFNWHFWQLKLCPNYVFHSKVISFEYADFFDSITQTDVCTLQTNDWTTDGPFTDWPTYLLRLGIEKGRGRHSGLRGSILGIEGSRIVAHKMGAWSIHIIVHGLAYGAVALGSSWGIPKNIIGAWHDSRKFRPDSFCEIHFVWCCLYYFSFYK